MTDTTDPDRDAAAAGQEPNPETVATPGDALTPPAEPLPPERVGRGLLFSLVMIPVGIVLWVLIWQLGFISALVAFAVVIGVTFLYRLGSGGRVSMRGLFVILAVTLVTLVLAFLGGVAADIATFLEVSLFSVLGNPEFWDTFALNLFDNPELWAEYTPTILISLAFAALGTFSVFRSISKEAREANA